jgi:hypothetical protein
VRNGKLGFKSIDIYIRTQLAKAAEAYTSPIDIDARLQAVLAAEKSDKDDCDGGADS